MADWILLANGKIKVSENNTGAVRIGTIKVTNEENADVATIKITQGFKEYVLEIGTITVGTIVAYSPDGSGYNVPLTDITSKVTSYLKNDVTGNIPKNVNVTVKSGPATITGGNIVFTENETVSTRTVVLLITQEESGLTKEVTLTQAEGTHEYTFTADPEITVNYAAQEITPNVTSTRLINGHKTEQVDWTIEEI